MRRALVIGGGIGGLTAAIALRRAGWDAQVFERTPVLEPVGAGIGLWLNALRAFDRIGVGEAVRAAGVPDSDGALRRSDGITLLVISNAELRTRFGDVGFALHRADLHDILLHALDHDVHLAKELVGIDESADRVTARFADGTQAGGDILIGADGIRSAVRRHLHGDVPLRYAGYTAWRAVLAFPSQLLLPGESWGSGERFGQVPLSGERAYVFATANVPAGQHSSDGEKGELIRRFGRWHEPIPQIVEALREGEVLRNDIVDFAPLRQWGRGRVTLLGDAAHAMTPNLGQGACQAIEDAVVLARHLSGASEPVTALRAYEAERRPRAASFVRRSRNVGRVAQWSHPLAVALRNFAVRHVPARVQQRQLEDLASVVL